MAKISIQECDGVVWQRGRDLAPPDVQERLPEEEGAGSLIKVHRMGDDVSPQLIEVRMQPNATVGVHAHDADEIIYVVAGEMRFGSKVLKPGSSLFVQGGAFYSFGAGDEGLQFLNFRPHQDLTYHMPHARA